MEPEVDITSNIKTAKIKRRLAADKHPFDFDIAEFQHSFDPLGIVYNQLATNCDLITNLNVPNGIVQDIVSFVGYIESKLNNPASNAYSNSPDDCELCFLLSPPHDSPYGYKYTLDSFRCHVRSSGDAKIRFVIGTFFKGNQDDDDGENEYHELYNSGVIELSDSSETELPPEYQVTEEESYWTFKGQIFEFKHLNLKLSNDIVYVMRVDIVEGWVGCAELNEPVPSLNAHINPEKVEFVCDRTRFCSEEYTLRAHDRGKLYELVLH